MLRFMLLITAFIVTPWSWSDATKDSLHTPFLESPVQPSSSLQPSTSIQQQRQLFQQAKAAHELGDTKSYRGLRQQLQSYPLRPYLDYQDIRQQLDTLPYPKVDAFLEQHQDTYLGKLLLSRWLRLLASRKHWHEYRSYYLPVIQSDQYECWYIWSRYQTGDRAVLKEAERLWNVAYSQPDECDPLFKQWRQAGFLTVELVWERHRKAILKGQKRLARYLRKYMPKHVQQQAITFQRTLYNPALLNKKEHYQGNDPFSNDVIFYSLSRYARSAPEKSLSLWQYYQQQHDFTARQKQSFYYRLAKEFAFMGNQQALTKLLSHISDNQKTIVIEIVLRTLLHDKNWQEVLNWISYLPHQNSQSNRWRYWQARAEQALALPHKNYYATYSELAQTRSFYGFLSADRLNQDYSLQHSPSQINEDTVNKVKNHTAMIRARELFYVGELHHARWEWVDATDNLSMVEHQAAAKLAYEWGWYRKSIESMAAAKAWDDLNIRFPVAHESIVLQQAQATQLPPTLIFAIARQESAWGTDAQSSAGAMGLMQLLPRTAKDTADKAGLKHHRSDLLKPEHNITLGSRYISELLLKYQNHRVLAIAAYNAGPSRVNRWLEKSNQRLPNDIWIESIPFKETRKYVKNVLSYSVVYAYRMGQKTSLLTRNELANLL